MTLHFVVPDRRKCWERVGINPQLFSENNDRVFEKSLSQQRDIAVGQVIHVEDSVREFGLVTTIRIVVEGDFCANERILSQIALERNDMKV